MVHFKVDLAPKLQQLLNDPTIIVEVNTHEKVRLQGTLERHNEQRQRFDVLKEYFQVLSKHRCQVSIKISIVQGMVSSEGTITSHAREADEVARKIIGDIELAAGLIAALYMQSTFELTYDQSMDIQDIQPLN